MQREEIRQGIACVKHQNMSGSDIGDDHKEYFAGEAALKAGGAHNTMNQFAAYGTLLTQAVQAGIQALPLYLLQRARPGLYELFQTYRAKAELLAAAALKSCEEMEATLRQDGNPYEDWIKLAKGEDWKIQSSLTADATRAKRQVELNGGSNGVTWVYGLAGGQGQKPIEVIRDLTQAGYQTTMVQTPSASPTLAYPASGPGATKLARAFPTAKAAADWAVAVLGDTIVATCDRVNCPVKGTIAGTGLLPRFEQERPQAETALTALVTATAAPDRAALEAASAPGVALSRELVDALRELRPADRALVLGRLSAEIAQARVIDKALTVRNLLLTGLGVPEAGFDAARKEARQAVETLNRYIDDLLFEIRVRREIVSQTAQAVLDDRGGRRGASSEVGDAGRADPRPLQNGRVQP